MSQRVNPAVIIGVSVLVIILAALLIFRSATKPGETITRFEDVPPKGAGKFDR